MKCKKCNHTVPEDSEFCPYCGASIEKGQTCPECGQVLPEDSLFCPFCGCKMQSTQPKQVEFPSEKKEQKTPAKSNVGAKKTFRVVLISIVAIVVVAGAYFGLNTIFAKRFIAAEEYSKAAACFDRIFIAKKMYPGEYEYAKAGRSFEKGDINSFSFYTKLEYLSRTYPEAISKAKINELTISLYNTAVNWYETGNYGSSATEKETAFQYFNAVKPYKDSSKYLALLNGRADTRMFSIDSKMSITTETVVKYIDFQDAKEVLVSTDVISWDFLRGSWKTSDGSYYLNVENNGDVSDSHMSYNIPFFEMEDAYLGIIDGHVFLYSTDLEDAETAYTLGKYKLLFDISVINAQQVTIYSYKSDSNYILFRDI